MIKILIKPILEWSEGEDVPYFSEDAEQYMFNDEEFEIEDGETFEIPDGCIGELLLEEEETLEVHPIKDGVDLGLQMGFEVEDGDELDAGKYELKGGVVRKNLQ